MNRSYSYNSRSTNQILVSAVLWSLLADGEVMSVCRKMIKELSCSLMQLESTFTISKLRPIYTHKETKYTLSIFRTLENLALTVVIFCICNYFIYSWRSKLPYFNLVNNCQSQINYSVTYAMLWREKFFTCWETKPNRK